MGITMNLIEEFLFINRAAIYDIASIFGILGFLLVLASVRFGSRLIAATCGWMFASAVIFAGVNWAAECHYESRQTQLRGCASPYFLAGYYSAR